jgi:hypothetical protein
VSEEERSLGARPTLLVALESLVSESPGSARLAGTLSIGVRTPTAEHWWSVDLGARPVSRILDERPAKSDCFVLLGEREAKAIVREGRLPEQRELFEVRGDAALFDRFVRFYAGGKTIFGLRAEGA